MDIVTGILVDDITKENPKVVVEYFVEEIKDAMVDNPNFVELNQPRLIPEDVKGLSTRKYYSKANNVIFIQASERELNDKERIVELEYETKVQSDLIDTLLLDSLGV